MSQQSDSNNRLTGILEKVAISALFLIVTWQWTAIGKVEERVYSLQEKSFTEEKARILEDRLTKSIDGIRADVNNKVEGLRSDMNSKLDLLIKMQTENPSRR